MNTTDKFRTTAWTLLVTVVVSALVGWFMDKDPSLLVGVIAAVAGAVTAGEAANVGKRATYNPEA